MVPIKDKIAEIHVSYRPAIANKPIIKTGLDAYVELAEFFPRETIGLQEKFVAMYLNKANRVLGVYQLSTGGLTGTVADIRLVLSVALKTAATGIIIAHNHPSGNLKPSVADLEITRRIKEGGKLLEIVLLDHLILSPIGRGYYSFADDGVL